MAFIRYKGKKPGGMPIQLPVGTKFKHKVTDTVVANPVIELSDQDAKKLVEVDSHNFELISKEEAMKHETPEKKVQEKGKTEQPKTGSEVSADTGFKGSAPVAGGDKTVKTQSTASTVKKSDDSDNKPDFVGEVAPDGIKPAILSTKEPNDANKGNAGTVSPSSYRGHFAHPFPASVDPTVKQHNAEVENPGRDDARDPNTGAIGDPETIQAIEKQHEHEEELRDEREVNDEAFDKLAHRPKQETAPAKPVVKDVSVNKKGPGRPKKA